MKMSVAAALSAVLLGACVATTPRIDESRLQEVRAGKTSYVQIVKHFGTPSLLSRNPDGTSFATYVHADPGAAPSTIVPLVAGQHRDSVTFYFDANGLLADMKMTSRTGLEARPADTAAGSTSAPHPRTTEPSAAPSVSVSAPSTARTGSKSGGWIWRLPDWLPAAPRENR